MKTSKTYKIYYNAMYKEEKKEVERLLPSDSRHSPLSIIINFEMTDEEFTLFWLATCDFRQHNKMSVYTCPPFPSNAAPLEWLRGRPRRFQKIK